MVTGTSSSAVLIAAAGGTVVLAPGDEGDALSSASHAQRRVSTNERAILEKSRSTWGGGAKRLLSQAAQKGGRKGRALSAPKMIVGMRKRRFCSWASPRLVMASRLVMYALLFALLPSPIICESEDYYCGMDWVHAANACPKPCPTGTDVECTDQLGDEYACFYYTGCYERYQSGEFGPLETDEPEEIEEGGGQEEQQVIEATLPPNANQYCASTWLQAMINCGGLDEEKACPNGDHDCDENEMCQTDTYCDQPLKELESEVQFTLKGPENTLEKVEEQTILLNVTGEYLRGTLETLEISFTSMEILEQEMVTGEVKVNVMIKAVHRPAMGTFTQKLDSIAENTINLQGQDVVKELKRKGNSEQEYYFTKVSEISVLSTEQLTELPTKSPAGAPTVKPSKEPTKSPTPFPTISGTDWPSEMPSEMPSRPFLTSLTTATRRELTKATSTSYGYVFNVRTKAEVGAVLVKGMDFYTDKFGSVNYELWTRPGTFIGYRGRYAGWELIATGSIKGKGAGELTSIPEEDFTEVSINGGGSDQGTRAFYITLNSKDLVYEVASQGGSFASKADVNVHDETDELEIYDGEAILAYPFPPQSQSYMYRAPRKFLGTIYYDRLPCRPLSAFGIIRELPCPEGVAPTASPTIFSPTIFATNVPSIGGAVDEKPAIRANPTPAPSTLRGSISSDYFCGKSWVDAMTHCRVPCPSGENSECADIDPDYECQGFTGCSQAKLLLTDPPSGSPSKRPTSNPTTLKPTNPLTDSPTGRPTTASPTPSRTTFEDAAEDPSETESVDYSEGSIVSPTKKPIDGLADVAAASDEEGDAASDEENPPAAVEDADATGDVGLDAGEASVGTAGRSTTTQATAISVAGGGASDESSGTESTQIAAPSPSDGEGEAPAEEENADQVDPSTVESSEDAAGGETETIDFVEDFAEDEPLVEPLAGSACSCTQLFGRGVMAFSIALLI
mmetsp:Transcript_14335/g.31447  ORF Transcript_14335/g.31447 Transcript_14335/m.31447 type:complete len:963 (-) Transcript_14335:75-2963(-)